MQNNCFGYEGYYDIEGKKREKREKRFPSFATGMITGVIIQFLGDVIFSTIYSGNSVIEEDIEISSVPEYYAAAISGGITGFISLYMDRFAVAFFSNVTYAFTNNFIAAQLNETEFDIAGDQIIFDIIVTEIILYLFDRTSVNDFINHRNERLCINTAPLDADKSIFDIIFIVFITNTYFAFRDNIVPNNATATGIGATIDNS